jgi:hypothetical protein
MTITSVAELDALPAGTVVVGTSGTAYQSDPAWPDALPEHELPVHVVYRPDRDLLAEARAEGAREAADRIAEAARTIRNAQLDTWGYVPDTVGHILAGYGQAEGVARP